MKSALVGTERGLVVLPPWPEDFSIMEMLERGLFIKTDKKTGEWEIRIGSKPRETPEKR